MCTAALLMAATKVFMDPRIKKMSNMYTMEYYSDIKKKEILRQMDGRLGHHVKLNNSDSERSIQYDLSYTWISLLKKKDPNS